VRRSLQPLFLVAAACAVLCGAPVRAQESPARQPVAQEAAQEPPTGGDGLQRADIEILRQRYRPALHPGDPLRIVGNEQDGNQLRARTPLLARGEHTPLQVDIEASYQRALAMYGDGAVYHTQLPPANKAEPVPRALRPRVAAPEPAPRLRGPEATPWSVLAGLFVSVLLLVWFFVRVRPALVAPKELQATPEPQAEDFVFRPTRRANPPVSLPKFEPPAALPQGPAPVDNGARMGRRPKQR